jgi:hypothetical protein
MISLEAVVRLLEVFFPMLLLVAALGGLVVAGSILFGRNLGKGQPEGHEEKPKDQ